MIFNLKLNVLTMKTSISLETGSLIGLKFTGSTRLTGVEPQGLSCLHFPSAAMTIINHQAFLLVSQEVD